MINKIDRIIEKNNLYKEEAYLSSLYEDDECNECDEENDYGDRK